MLRKNLFVLATFVWILIDITACTTMTPPAPKTSNVSWETRQSSLNRLQNWQLTGKVAVTTSTDSGSANMNWSQRAQNYTISLYGPLGAGNMTLTGRPGHVSLKDSKNTVFANSPEQLLAQQWGFRLPVSNLKYWIRGLPVPGLAQQSKFDEAHRLVSLHQDSFSIQYEGYTEANGLELPQRITINSPSLKSKIVIYQWNIS